MKIDPDQNAEIKRDLMLYGNAFVHLAYKDGELKARRLAPAEVIIQQPK